MPAKYRVALPLIVTVLVLSSSTTVSASGNFTTVTLPRGVSIELPRNWVVLSDNQRITLDSSVESGLDLSGGEPTSSELAFAANLYDDNRRTIGIFNIRYYPELGLSQVDARDATGQDVAELDAELRRILTKQMQAAGMSVTSWKGTTKAAINGITAFITDYRRASLRGSGDFRVRLVRVFAGKNSFTLTVSYSESASILLQPITDRIINSLKLASASMVNKRSGKPAAKSDDYGEQWLLLLIVSLFWTWGLGLAPALLIRFVFLRRPITKLSAIVIVALWWAAMFLVGSALGSQSNPRTALVLVALASYAILRKSAKKQAEPVQSA